MGKGNKNYVPRSTVKNAGILEKLENNPNENEINSGNVVANNDANPNADDKNNIIIYANTNEETGVLLDISQKHKLTLLRNIESTKQSKRSYSLTEGTIKLLQETKVYCFASSVHYNDIVEAAVREYCTKVLEDNCRR